jgi:hypothetical protein
MALVCPGSWDVPNSRFIFPFQLAAVTVERQQYSACINIYVAATPWLACHPPRDQFGG